MLIIVLYLRSHCFVTISADIVNSIDPIPALKE